MDPVTFSLVVSSLGQGLLKAFEKLLEKGVVDPAFEKGLSPLRSMLTRGYDEKKDEEDLRRVLLDVLDELTQSDDLDQYEKLLATLKLTGLQPSTRTSLAAIALEMSKFEPSFIPDEIMKELGLEESARNLLTHFLFVLRKKLSTSKNFSYAIFYIDRLEERGLLQGIANQIISLTKQNRRLLSVEEAIIVDRRLAVDEAHALRNYLDVVRRQLRYLLLPLAHSSKGDIQADADLKQIFVPLKMEEKHSLGGEFGISELINSHEKFVLLGPPGSGKTTLLRRIALAFAEGRAAEDLGWTHELLLPIFVRLRNFGTFLIQHQTTFSSPGPGALTAYLDHYFRQEYRLSLTPDFFDHRLNEGRCFILLDGLDEVSQSRSEVAQQVNSFIRFYGRSESSDFEKKSLSEKKSLLEASELEQREDPEVETYRVNSYSEIKPKAKRNRFGLSSRPRGYETVEVNLRSIEPAICNVAPLDSQGISQLVKNLLWLIENNSTQREKDFHGLHGVILSSQQLKEIAGTPLFCTALVLVYKYHGAQLPQRRVDVFQEIVDLLLGFWKAQEQELAKASELALEDGTGVLFPDLTSAVAVKKRRLSYLAYKMQEERKTEITREYAIDILKDYLVQRERKQEGQSEEWATNFLRNSHERSGLLVELESDLYAFSHQNFREYLAATALVNQRENQFVETVLKNINDDWWEQVILLACAHSNLSEGSRSFVIEKMLEKSITRNNKEKKNNFQSVRIAGLAARDMGDYLLKTDLVTVENSLFETMTDVSEQVQDRATAGDILDALNWLPSDLFQFIQIIDSQDDTRFWVSKYPITNYQYRRFLYSKDYTSKEYWSNFYTYCKSGDLENFEDEWRAIEIEQDELHSDVQRGFPVTGISWYAANAYSKWLLTHWNEIPESQTNPQLQPQTLRLPTEHEWILAAGGKSNGRFPWENNIKIRATRDIYDRANIGILKRKTSVCMFPSGKSFPFGLLDMAGNVWEWTQTTDHTRKFIITKGGSFVSQLWCGKVGSKEMHNPAVKSENIGFRIILFE